MFDDEYAFIRRLFLIPSLSLVISLFFSIDKIKLLKSAFDFHGELNFLALFCVISLGLYILNLLLTGNGIAREKRKINHSHFELFGHVFWDSDIPAEDPDAKTMDEVLDIMFDDAIIPLVCISHFFAALLNVNMGDRVYKEYWDEKISAIFDLAKLIISIIVTGIIVGHLTGNYEIWKHYFIK